MRSFTIKNYYRIGLSLTALSVTALINAASAKAATFTIAGYAWDSANAVTTGKIIQGQEQTEPFTTPFLSSEPEVRDRTIGKLFGGSTSDSSESFTLGKNNLTVSIIELGWGRGISLANEDGQDLVIYETGGSGEPEAFAVAIKKVGASDFTEYLYQVSTQNYQADPNTTHFATAIDLSSFGLNLGDEIESIRIKNLIPSDTVTGDGQGFLGGGNAPKVGPNSIKQNYELGKFDPDITFVAGLHQPKPVPEPAATLGLLALGAFGISSLGKRKRQQ
ncbi:MAG: PEP-CTERM sorting domain-containing protein [Phormidium sp.]